jgi:hypothetical protein
LLWVEEIEEEKDKKVQQLWLLWRFAEGFSMGSAPRLTRNEKRALLFTQLSPGPLQSP